MCQHHQFQLKALQKEEACITLDIHQLEVAMF
jgi:hypothetical protein